MPGRDFTCWIEKIFLPLRKSCPNMGKGRDFYSSSSSPFLDRGGDEKCFGKLSVGHPTAIRLCVTTWNLNSFLPYCKLPWNFYYISVAKYVVCIDRFQNASNLFCLKSIFFKLLLLCFIKSKILKRIAPNQNIQPKKSTEILLTNGDTQPLDCRNVIEVNNLHIFHDV